MRIAVLALQGAFVEHEKMMSRLGVSTFEIRGFKDMLISFDGIILPGGESTVQGALLRELGIFCELKKLIIEGMPVFGTCAGMILLADRLVDDEARHLGTLSVDVVRNAYGRQLGSFYCEGVFADIGTVPMTFIRAPYVKKVFNDTQILGTIDGRIVAVRQKNQLATSFHPELNDNSGVHEYFINMVGNK